MKIAIYSSYLDTFGGGEKYMMTIAEIFSSNNTVDVLMDRNLDDQGGDFLKNELSKRFDLNLESVNFIIAPVGKSSSSISRLVFLKRYDMFFYLTDGSIFFPTAKKNILHIQSPLKGEVNSLQRKIKLKGWDLIIYNSKFTEEHSKKNWPVKSTVIYPPVDVDKIKPLKKKKYILSVGRFFGYLKDKKHSVMIKTFKDLYKSRKIDDWSLHLVGSAAEGDISYLKQLKNLAKNFPIVFYPNLEYIELVRLYGESSIYWHAAGYKETDPTKMEHFGISIVEAMAAGCVPVVINKGGQKETIANGIDGLLWDDLEQLKKLTVKLAGDVSLMQKMSEQAIKLARRFNKNSFTKNILRLTA